MDEDRSGPEFQHTETDDIIRRNYAARNLGPQREQKKIFCSYCGATPIEPHTPTCPRTEYV